MKSYNKSVIGSSHIDAKLPRQDFSMKKVVSGCYTILAISDGHGSKEYVRSDRGAKFACEIAIEKTQEFVDRNSVSLKGLNIASGPNEVKGQELKTLFNSICDAWRKRVDSDVNGNPFTDEENRNRGRGDNNYTAYGCTLIVGVKTPDFVFGFQIGDGRFFTISYANEWEQPIPWDKGCNGNITTSMCEDNAAERFRCYISSDQKKRPFAIFLCSDGIEDCYDGSHDGDFHSDSLSTEYSELISSFLKEESEFDAKCGMFLTEQSKVASHDDMSIAFCVDDYKNQQDKWADLVNLQADLNDIETQKRENEKEKEEFEKRLKGIKQNIAKLEEAKRASEQNRIAKEDEQKNKEAEIRELTSDYNSGIDFMKLFKRVCRKIVRSNPDWRPFINNELINDIKNGLKPIYTSLSEKITDKERAKIKTKQNLDKIKGEIDALEKQNEYYNGQLETQKNNRKEVEESLCELSKNGDGSDNSEYENDLREKIQSLQRTLSSEEEASEGKETSNGEGSLVPTLTISKNEDSITIEKSQNNQSYVLELNNPNETHKIEVSKKSINRFLGSFVKKFDKDEPEGDIYLAIQRTTTDEAGCYTKYCLNPNDVEEIWNSLLSFFQNNDSDINEPC